MISRIIQYFSAASAIVLLLLSCTQEMINYESSVEEQVRVPVSLSFQVTGMEAGTPETKTLMEPDCLSSSELGGQIANFVVLQFDGVSPDALPVGEQLYFDRAPQDVETIPLVASGEQNTIVVMANTFGPVSITSRTTLSSFMAQAFTTINSLNGMFMVKDGDEYIRMSGSALASSVGAGTALTVELKRNVAKIVVNVCNTSSGAGAVNLSQFHLQCINTKYYYFTHVDPLLTQANSDIKFKDTYSPSLVGRIDDAPKVFPADKNPTGEHHGDAEQYVFYIPANMRGTTGSHYQYSKGNGAPDGATRICLTGSYTDNSDPSSPRIMPVNYIYYLGSNLENDFNIKPNYKYTYTITIPSKGDGNFDYRIDDTQDVTFDVDANCYMLHPPEVEGQTRTYRIPVRRAAVFWNQSDIYGINYGSDVYYGASSMTGYSSHKMDASTPWTAKVLWSDFDLSGYTGGNAFLQVGSGTGFDPSHTQPYITVRVTAGMKGNVVVGLEVGGDNLWSWHFWITDYDPDRNVEIADGQYVYGVGHGNVHRYKGALWTTAPTDSKIGYSNGYIMDRNLGAVQMVYSNTAVASTGLYYQYGRKDPFLDRNQGGMGDNYFYLNGTTETRVLIANSNSITDRRVNSDFNVADESKNMRFSVKNPMVLIGENSSGNWTSDQDDLACGSGTGYTNFLWNDRKFWLHNGSTTQHIFEKKKSVYDPCPPGWKLPTTGFNADFSSSTVSINNEGLAAMFYFPGGKEGADISEGAIFTALGALKGTGETEYRDRIGYMWVASMRNFGISSRFQYDVISGAYNLSRDWYKNNAYGVRCVHE